MIYCFLGAMTPSARSHRWLVAGSEPRVKSNNKHLSIIVFSWIWVIYRFNYELARLFGLIVAWSRRIYARIWYTTSLADFAGSELGWNVGEGGTVFSYLRSNGWEKINEFLMHPSSEHSKSFKSYSKYFKWHSNYCLLKLKSSSDILDSSRDVKVLLVTF